jgi:Flp pilus assembly pilin Flp
MRAFHHRYRLCLWIDLIRSAANERLSRFSPRRQGKALAGRPTGHKPVVVDGLTVVRNGLLAGTAIQSPLRTHSEEYDHQTGVYRLRAGSRGQTIAEYAMILATIAVVSVALVQNAGTIVTELVNHVSALF